MPDELKKIKKMRQKLGITQSELAKLSKVSQSVITKIERGTIEPSYTIAKRILKTLETELAGQQDQVKAKDICSKKIIKVSSNDNIENALDLMIKNAISQIPVIENNVIVGSISEEIFIKKFSKIKNKDIKIKDLMDEAFPMVPEDADITLINEILRLYPALIVVRNGKPLGIISKTDIIKIYPK